jgi:four helix bundle protein
LHSLSVAHGSVRELETQALIAQRLGFLVGNDLAPVMNQCAEVGRLLNGLMNSLCQA